MEMDLDAAVSFVATHGRLLDRKRLRLLLGDGSADDVLAALDAYRNPDGGYGWALEPDQRSVTSQPVGAMHALEVMADVRDVESPRPIELCDWLSLRTLPDGGMPFGFAYKDVAGSAKHWVEADPTTSSLQMTTQLAAQAHRLARHRADVAKHPWLALATDYCLEQIDQIVEAPHAYVLMFAIHFLDAVGDERALALTERLTQYVVKDGPTPVAGGAEGEALHLLDFIPYAEAPSRKFFTRPALDADLDRLARGQQPDGGWTVDYPIFSPAAALEWRGYATLRAVTVLTQAGAKTA